MELRNNTVLVTGGGSGIGLALANAFVRHDSTVIICGRNPAKLEAVRNDNPAIITHVCDIADDREQLDLIDQVTREFPGLNVLINNAGIQHNYDFGDGEDHTAMIEEESGINFLSHVKLTDRLLPFLMQRPQAAIVNVSSALAIVPKRSAPVYCATKAAMHNFGKALRYQLERTAVRVFEIVPALVDTEMTAGRGRHKTSPAAVAADALRGIKADRYEIRIGKTKILFLLHRLVPSLADRIIRNG